MNDVEFPPFIHCYAEFVGKLVSEFSLDDWRNAAINAGSILEHYWERDNPIPRRRGAPRKNPKPGTLGYLVKFGRLNKPAGKRGRPMQTYGRKRPLSAESIAEILTEVMSIEFRDKFPAAPKTETNAARMIANSIDYPKGQVTTMLRAVRRVKTDTKRKKSKP